MEYVNSCQKEDVDSEGCTTFFYQQGIPFWADGVNVLYNYISEHVGGLFAIGKKLGSYPLLSKLIQPLRDVLTQ